MDINNPGEEILKKANHMQQNADLQQAKQEELQGFQRQTFFAEHPALSDAELEQFEQDQAEMLHEFVTTYNERAIKGMPEPPGERFVIQLPEGHPWLEEPKEVLPIQEEPDEKTLKKQQKQREKKIEKGKKKGILAASEYSTDMQKEYSAYMKQREKAKYRQTRNADLWKNYMKAFEVDPLIGDSTHVGKNIIEIQSYMDDIKEALDYYTSNPEILSTMTLTFQQKVGSALQSYPAMEAAYENALLMNGLKRSGKQLVPIDANDLLRLRSDEEVRQTLIELDEKNKAELKPVVDVEVEIHSKRLVEQTRRETQVLRDAYKTQENTSFIETERIDREQYFETLDIFASMLEKHPEEYAANKEVLDSMMVYVRNIMEALSLHNEETHFEDKMPQDIVPEVEAAIYVRQDEAEFKKDELQEAIQMVEMSLKHILQGESINDRMADFLYQFGYASPEYLAEQKKIVESAKLYKDTFELKTAIWMSILANEKEEVRDELNKDSRSCALMQTEDTEEAHRYNQEVLEAKKHALKLASWERKEGDYRILHKELGPEDMDEELETLQKEKESEQLELVRLYKPKFQKLYDKVMNMEVESLQNMNPQELMKRQEDFLSIGMENMHLSDCCKVKDPVTKKSIRELVFPSPEFEEIYRNKVILIQNYMVMGRMLSMMEAYRKDSLTRDMLTGAELRKTKVLDLAGEASDEVLEYAKQGYNAAKKTAACYQKMLEAAYKKHFEAYYASEKKQSDKKFTPKKMEDKIEKTVSNNKEYILDETEKNNRVVYYNLLEGGRQEEADLLEASIALMKSRYHLAGETLEIKEPLFRSFNWAEITKGLRDMPESEFLDIIKLLSAGHLKLSKEQVIKEKVLEPIALEKAETQEAFQAKNKEGLRRLVHATAPHLNYLEKKYGYEIPTYEYVVSHMDELHDDFLFGQVTEDIVAHFDVLDGNNPEDVRLMHQIHFYNEVGIKAYSLFTQSKLDEEAGGTKLELINLCRDTSIIADSMNYLKTHPMAAGAGE